MLGALFFARLCTIHFAEHMMRMPGLSYSMRLHALASSDESATPAWGLDAQDPLSILSLQVFDGVEGGLSY